jgi:hypothetical protein
MARPPHTDLLFLWLERPLPGALLPPPAPGGRQARPQLRHHEHGEEEMTISGRELARIRADSETLTPETGRVLLKVSTPSEGGGQRDSWVPGADLPCAIVERNAMSGSAGDQLDERTTHVVTLPARSAVSVLSRVQVDGYGTFEVTGVHTRSYEIVRRVECMQLPEEQGS